MAVIINELFCDGLFFYDKNHDGHKWVNLELFNYSYTTVSVLDETQTLKSESGFRQLPTSKYVHRYNIVLRTYLSRYVIS